MQIVGRQSIATRNDPMNAERGLDKPHKRRLHFQHRLGTAGRHQRDVTNKLQRIANPLFRMQQNRAAGDILPLP